MLTEQSEKVSCQNDSGFATKDRDPLNELTAQ